MAFFRGGRGGRGGRSFFHAKPRSFELFPAIPELGTAAGVKQDIMFARRYMVLENNWATSPFYIGDESGSSKRTQRKEIERFSDRKLGRTRAKERLSDYVRMDPDYVPAELAKEERKDRRGVKRVRLNPDSDLKRLDFLEKLEHERQGDDRYEKKDKEEEEDEVVEEGEEGGSESDNGDYDLHLDDFQDDEDDFNLSDDDDGEGTYND
ncbi:OLC1v1014899C1 [Oldenlandia corymbosa var. corymbosa]|uniref:OLC1v1014899C1 n=1 Tax=Oldenlandia corymbosa var. corymbosa TaxID=529605 RepID=A0AAV1E239_OLDCO|nr:OLC1v1014899C1 [Oldenlandia corymbosa var. corymbosa]